MKTLQMMFKNCLIHQIVIKMITDLYQLVKTNVIGIMKDELGDKIVTEFVALIPKTYSCLTDNDIDSKNQKQLRFKSEGHYILKNSTKLH